MVDKDINCLSIPLRRRLILKILPVKRLLGFILVGLWGLLRFYPKKGNIHHAPRVTFTMPRQYSIGSIGLIWAIPITTVITTPNGRCSFDKSPPKVMA